MVSTAGQARKPASDLPILHLRGKERVSHEMSHLIDGLLPSEAGFLLTG
jgi:hypothetical protein